MSETQRPFCCYINPSGKSCGKDAEYEIIGGSGHFEDYTHSCTEHVGAMLSTPAWLTKLNTQWTVVDLYPACGGTGEARQ